MRPGGGKPKGSAYEREVCTALSLWLSLGARKDLFWRSAMSGGRSTVGKKRGDTLSSQVGDISAVDPMGEWLLRHVVVECKAYNDLQIPSFILAETGLLSEFWTKLRRQAREFRRHPMLVARQDGRPPFIVLDSSSMHRFRLEHEHVAAHVPRKDAHLVLFDCFLREARAPGFTDAPVLPSRAVI